MPIAADSATIPESVKLLHSDARRAVMSLRKLYLYGILAAILSCTSVSADFPPIQSIPAQSKSAKNLAVGKLLVASRNLGDPSFAKSVILLVRYDEKGVLGLMLNHRTDVPLSRALETLKAAKDRTDPVYLGGPVDLPSVFALYQSPTKLEGAENIFDGIYLIAAKPLFEQTISARPDPHVFHVYLGYAGWTQEQLQQEVALGAWFVFPADANTVFNDDPDSLWQEMIRKTELQMARSQVRDGDLSVIPALSDLK
jgi:putative AlgH/UPF0301 family transcriptional regulator